MAKKARKRPAKKTQQPRKHSKSAVASLVLGIASIVVGWIPIIGWGLLIVTVVLASIGIAETRGGVRKGRGVALAGLALAGFSILLSILAVIGILLLFTVSSSAFAGGAGSVTEHIYIGEGLEEIRVVTVEGANIERTISGSEPVELSIAGAGNRVTVAAGTPLRSIQVEGYDNTILLPENSAPEITDRGIATRIVRA